MARKNIYLGKRVKDVGKKGLDTLKEVEGICRAIISDFKNRRISYAKAMRRLVFLKTTVIKRNEKLEGKKKKAYAVVDRFIRKLKGLRGGDKMGRKRRKGRKKKIGFAAMSKKKRKQIAKKGARARWARKRRKRKR